MLLPPRSQTPPILFPEDRSIDSASGRWWVAHTKSRFEKAFAWDLIDRKISYFLPLVPRIHLHGGTQRKFLVPLFPTYVFFRGTGHHRIEALSTGRLCHVIDVADQITLVEELSRLHIALKSPQGLDRCALPAGQLCRVIMGPLMGCEGIVVENSKMTRLVLQVSILGQAFSVEIDRDLLEPVGPDRPLRPVRIAG